MIGNATVFRWGYRIYPRGNHHCSSGSCLRQSALQSSSSLVADFEFPLWSPSEADRRLDNRRRPQGSKEFKATPINSDAANGVEWHPDECASHTTRSLLTLMVGWSGSTSIPRKAIGKQLERLNERLAREVQREVIKQTIRYYHLRMR